MLRFVVLSGGGWCVDFVLLILLVRCGVVAGVANFISACVAAGLVYWLSRSVAFRVDSRSTAAAGLLIYVLYTIGIVAIFSILLEGVARYLVVVIGPDERSWSISVMLAKIIVTPLNLLVNYLVARTLVRRMG
ncbi:GtrA family protein [Cupriavidus necator]|uniref:GtrA family protein n=1 Tax=Cupriavidus necator TaxID=106590 RepID=UPI003F73FB81